MLFFSAGAYEHDLKRNKKVQWHQSFGGQPVLMPSIKVRSIIDQNTDKVSMHKTINRSVKLFAYLIIFNAFVVVR